MRPSPRRPAVAGGDGADAGRGGHPSARPHCRAFRQGEEAKSTSRSVISRQFVRQTETALAELMVRDLNRVEHQSAHARWRAHGRALRGGHAGHHRRRDERAGWAVGGLHGEQDSGPCPAGRSGRRRSALRRRAAGGPSTAPGRCRRAVREVLGANALIQRCRWIMPMFGLCRC
jgi:hypothetical protein